MPALLNEIMTAHIMIHNQNACWDRAWCVHWVLLSESLRPCVPLKMNTVKYLKGKLWQNATFIIWKKTSTRSSGTRSHTCTVEQKFGWMHKNHCWLLCSAHDIFYPCILTKQTSRSHFQLTSDKRQGTAWTDLSQGQSRDEQAITITLMG